MTPLERAARAIEIALVEKTAHHPIAKLLPRIGWIYPILSRAVLEELREPSEAMTAAGAMEIFDRRAKPMSAIEISGPTWRAMLAVALEEKPS